MDRNIYSVEKALNKFQQLAKDIRYWRSVLVEIICNSDHYLRRFKELVIKQRDLNNKSEETDETVLTKQRSDIQQTSN